MDIDIKELIKTATENLNLKDFKGDIVAVKVVENEFGTIENGGVGIQNVYYNKENEEAETAANSPKSGSIPNPLNTPQAHNLWDIAKAEGWVDENLQPLISQPKAAILASVMADILRLSPRWQAFEELWGINDLATKLSISQNCNYYSSLLKTFEDKLT